MSVDNITKETWGQRSKNAWNDAWKKDNLGGSISSLAGGIGSIVQTSVSNSNIKDTSAEQAAIDDVASTQFGYGDYDSLMASYNPFGFAKTNYTKDDVRGASGMELFTNTLGAIGSGASTGATIGGPWGAVAGGVVGAIGGISGWVSGDIKARKEAERLNEEAKDANEIYLANYSNNASNISQNMFNSAALNIAAEGGQLDTYDQSKVFAKNFKMKGKKSRYKGFGNYYAYGGQMMTGDWSNGVVIIDEGGTHEENPLGGVLMGVDQQGVPNLVEEGEVIFNDYVYSNRLKPTEKQLKEVNLDTKLEGKTYAEIAKELQEESSLRPLDYISKNTLVDSMSKITVLQEETRMKKERQKILRALRQMPIQEPMMEVHQEEYMQEPMVEEMQNGIQMPLGEFSERTPRAYKQIQEEMPEQYAFGGSMGNIFQGTGSKSNYLETFGDISKFKYWNTTNNNYDQGYLNWLNTYDLTSSPSWQRLSDYYKSIKGTDLTVDTARALGKDRKFGNAHLLLGDAYSTYLSNLNNPTTTQSTNTTNTTSTTTPATTTTTPATTTTEGSGAVGSTTEGNGEEGKKNQQNPYPKYGFMYSLPGIMSGLSALASSFQKPDYSNTDLIARGRRGIRNVSARPIGNYLSFDPYDINYQQNKMINTNLGTQRNILGTTSGNRGTALADVLAQDLIASSKAGELYRNALEYNDQQRFKVGEFNRDTNKFNSQIMTEADRANQQADIQRASYYLQEADARDKLETAISEANNANLDTFFGNMGEIGKDIYTSAVEKWLGEQGVVPNGYTRKQAKGGRISRRKRRRC